MLYFYNLFQSINTKLSNEPFKSTQLELSDFYMTDSISRASPTMAKCVKAFAKRNQASSSSAKQ